MTPLTKCGISGISALPFLGFTLSFQCCSLWLPEVNFWSTRYPRLFRTDSDKNEIKTTWLDSWTWIVLPSPWVCCSNGKCQLERERDRSDREWWIEVSCSLPSSNHKIPRIWQISYLLQVIYKCSFSSDLKLWLEEVNSKAMGSYRGRKGRHNYNLIN